jgi:F0F1-type ATP synthase epsilon subunit
MDTFNKFKDWLLNIIGIAIIGGLVSIKNDLSDIKTELAVNKYKIDELEKYKAKSENKDSEQDKEIATIKAFVLPDPIKIRRRQNNEEDN